MAKQNVPPKARLAPAGTATLIVRLFIVLASHHSAVAAAQLWVRFCIVLLLLLLGKLVFNSVSQADLLRLLSGFDVLILVRH